MYRLPMPGPFRRAKAARPDLPSVRWPSRGTQQSAFLYQSSPPQTMPPTNCRAALTALLLLGPGCEGARDAAPEPVQAVPSAPAKAREAPDEAAFVQRFRLGLAELKKDLDEKGEVARGQDPAGAGGPERGLETKDGDLLRAVRKSIEADPRVPIMTLECEISAGQVVLTGRVADLEQLQAALLAVLRVPGSRTVVSKLLVEPDDGAGETK